MARMAIWTTTAVLHIKIIVIAIIIIIKYITIMINSPSRSEHWIKLKATHVNSMKGSCRSTDYYAQHAYACIHDASTQHLIRAGPRLPQWRAIGSARVEVLAIYRKSRWPCPHPHARCHRARVRPDSIDANDTEVIITQECMNIQWLQKSP